MPDRDLVIGGDGERKGRLPFNRINGCGSTWGGKGYPVDPCSWPCRLIQAVSGKDKKN